MANENFGIKQIKNIAYRTARENNNTAKNMLEITDALNGHLPAKEDKDKGFEK